MKGYNRRERNGDGDEGIGIRTFCLGGDWWMIGVVWWCCWGLDGLWGLRQSDTNEGMF